METQSKGTGQPIGFKGLKSAENVVFLGEKLTPECKHCGAYDSTKKGYKFCAHVTCPIALKEFKRRKRKRTSTLEQVYIPRKVAEKAEKKVGGTS